MKTTNFKTALLGTAIAFAMGLANANLHADQGQQTGVEPAPPPSHPSVQGDVNQPVPEPTDGQQLADDVERAAIHGDQDYSDSSVVEAEEFFETATAKGIAEIENAQLALEEGSAAIRTYANKMIEDHTVANNELRAVAEHVTLANAGRIDLDAADNPTLMDQAKSFVLSVRDGDDFDEAYVENQIAAHEETIELFEEAANSEIPELSAFARGKLPALQEHLRMAQALRTQISSR